VEEKDSAYFRRDNRTDGSLAHNMCKNRYRGFLPLDETRVPISPIDNVCGSDYINANFVSGEVPESQNAYIACQAPLSSTVEDFWRMVWEQNSGVIVMLCPIEIGQAEQYWPLEGDIAQYGRFSVFNKQSFILKGITVRSLLLRDQNPSLPVREIVHLHFEHWPDFGTTSSESLRDLLLLYNKFIWRASTQHRLSGPAVVHCSAGLGRTGVFLACHILLENIRQRVMPNVEETVRYIRNQRQGVVRTEDQYKLIYVVLQDALTSQKLRSSAEAECPSSCTIE